MVWMGVPEEVRAASEFYLRIYLLGMPGMTLYDFLSPFTAAMAMCVLRYFP